MFQLKNPQSTKNLTPSEKDQAWSHQETERKSPTRKEEGQDECQQKSQSQSHTALDEYLETYLKEKSVASKMKQQACQDFYTTSPPSTMATHAGV